jgi:hypothetical protein
MEYVTYQILMTQTANDTFELWCEINDSISMRIYGPVEDGNHAVEMMNSFNNNPFIVNLWFIKKMADGAVDRELIGPKDGMEMQGEHSDVVVLLDDFVNGEVVDRKAISTETHRRSWRFSDHRIHTSLVDFLLDSGFELEVYEGEEAHAVLYQIMNAMSAREN